MLFLSILYTTRNPNKDNLYPIFRDNRISQLIIYFRYFGISGGFVGFATFLRHPQPWPPWYFFFFTTRVESQGERGRPLGGRRPSSGTCGTRAGTPPNPRGTECEEFERRTPKLNTHVRYKRLCVVRCVIIIRRTENTASQGTRSTEENNRKPKQLLREIRG